MTSFRLPAPAITVLLTLCATVAVHAADAPAAAPVTVSDDGNVFTLANGIVTARVLKSNGNLASLNYKGIETTNRGYWSHNAQSNDTTARITINPNDNSGQRAEVAVKGISHGNQMGVGSPGGGAIADIEIRYTLEAGVPGIYTYTIWDHRPEYPATNVGEARFCCKLNDDVFDWMTVDAKRNFKMPTAYDWNHGIQLNMKEVRLLTSGSLQGHVEHKYDYSANQFDVLAWGWSSTTRHVGCWFINPTIEYLSGGPTKIELSAHRDATFDVNNKTAPAPPCLLNYWRGSHYSGSSIAVARGEAWTKVVGPFLIYCNNGDSPDAMWKDALARSQKESASWPYRWVEGVDYPHKDQRGTVNGQLLLQDPQLGTDKFDHLLVGLAHPDYVSAGGRGGGVNWQNDAKFYQFWVRANADGSFSIPNVRPGKYTLHAIASDVLGEFTRTDITVDTGKTVDMGQLPWVPVRYGRQLWEIGIPDRTAGEFFRGDQYNQWGLYLQYAKDFPQDVNYTVGKSDYHKDWNLMQVPHNENPQNTDGKGNGRATTWTINFDLDHALKGRATLRLAFAGTETRSLTVDVNGQNAGTLTGLMNTGAIHRDADRSYWQSRDVPFAASLLRAGHNTLQLTIPAGPLPSGIEYDYLRLELDDSAQAPQ